MQNGKILYRYTLKGNKFNVREGVVNYTGFRFLVNFRDGGAMVRCPRAEDIGKVRAVGCSLWLTERDDTLAKKLFIQYESKKIAELQKQIDKKNETIIMLMEE